MVCDIMQSQAKTLPALQRPPSASGVPVHQAQHFLHLLSGPVSWPLQELLVHSDAPANPGNTILAQLNPDLTFRRAECLPGLLAAVFGICHRSVPLQEMKQCVAHATSRPEAQQALLYT